MGTPEFASLALLRLLEEGHEVVAVFTKPDKPVGRKKVITPSAVKIKAVENKIPVYQPKTLKSPEQVEILKKINPDLIAVVAYGQILPKEILEIPRYGCVNVHASLLPKYRGASPIQSSILNGDKVTGVTTMYMSEGLDTGDIIKMAQTQIGENETAAELFARLAPMGASLLCQTLSEIENQTANRLPQDDEKATYAPILTKEIAKIDFSAPSETVHHKVCGLSDWPCAYCYLGEKKLKVYKSILNDEYFGRPGEILSKKKFIVACKTGAVEFVEVQLEGKKKMLAKDFLNGSAIEKGAILN